MKKRKKKIVKLDLNLDTYKFLREVSKLSGVSIDDVVGVTLASFLIAEKRKEASVRKSK